MKIKSTLGLSLAAALIAPVAFVSPAVAAPAPAPAQVMVSAEVRTAQAQLQAVDARIAELRTAQAQLPDSDYSDEIITLLNTAFELRGMIEKLIAGEVPSFDLATIGPRIDLFLSITDTIATAVTTLQDKVQPAHVELGFAVATAVVRLVNPSSTKDQIAESKKNLADVLARVSQYPNLQPGDTATIYVKAKLDRHIWKVRIDRDKNILGHKSFPVYNTLNRNITASVGVWFNPKATVADVNASITALDAAYATAAAAPNTK